MVPSNRALLHHPLKAQVNSAWSADRRCQVRRSSAPTADRSRSKLDKNVELRSGCEWVVEAHGCDPAALADARALSEVFADIIQRLDLRPIGQPAWHKFPEPGGGVTGLTMLSESHLACHTFPEYGSICLNLFCCRPRADYDFAGELKLRLGATAVRVRRIDRPYQP